MVDVFANRDVNGTMGPSDVLISMMHNKVIICLINHYSLINLMLL